MIRTQRTQGWSNSNQQNIASLATLPVMTGATLASTGVVASYALLGPNGNGSAVFTRMVEAGGPISYTGAGYSLENTPRIVIHASHARLRMRTHRFRANGVLAGPEVFRDWIQNAKDHDFHRTMPVNSQGIAYQIETLTGTLTPAGDVRGQRWPFLTGSVTPGGILSPGVRPALAGVLTFIGEMTFMGLATRALNAVLDLSGGLLTQVILNTRKFIVNAAKRLGYKRLNGE